MIETRSDILLPYPHAGQQAVRLQAKRFNWLCAGRRWRKSTLCMAIAVEAAAAGQRIVWGAPVFDQVRVSWGEMRRAASRVADFNMSRMDVTFPSGGTVTFRSLDNPDNARGHTADGVVIDEVGDVKPEAWFEVLRPMLIDTNGWFWGIGSARGQNWFWEEIERARLREDSSAWVVPTLGVAFDDDGELHRVRHALENPEIPFSEIVDLYQTLPRRVFQQEILSDFLAPAASIYLREWWAGKNRFDPDAIVDHPNRVALRICSWDTALKKGDENAYSAVVVAEVTHDRRLLVRDVWRDRLSFPELVTAIERVARSWNADKKLAGVLIEDKASGTSAHQTIAAASPSWLAGLVQPFMPSGDKRQRAEQASLWCARGMVHLPEPRQSVPWLLDFEDELYAAPAGRFMDQADAFAQAVIWLEHYLETGWRGRIGEAA